MSRSGKAGHVRGPGGGEDRPAADGRQAARLEGRVAVVTGGTSGIGRATCLAMAREGAGLVVVGRDRARLEGTVSEIRGLRRERALGVAADVREERDLEDVVRQTVDCFGRLDILVASAGIGKARKATGFAAYPVLKLETDAWDEIIDTNLTGIFLAVRAVLPTMMRRGSGQIVAVGSRIAGSAGQPYAAAYCASKFGLLGLCEALREEAGMFGVRLQVVLPGVVDTPLIRATTLARHGALAPSGVADFIVDLLTLPEDTVLVDPMIATFGTAASG